MNRRSRIPAGLAAFNLLMMSAPAGAGAGPSRPTFEITPRVGEGARGGFAAIRRREAQASCSAAATHAFIGAKNEGNATGGDASAVLGGSDNGACNDHDAIGGGTGNTIVNPSKSGATAFGNAFIGGGTGNRIQSGSSFVGAGESNNVYGQLGFIGAGSGNTVAGDGSAVLAGYRNRIDGTDSFVGAGESNDVVLAGSFVGGGGFTYVTTQSGTGIANDVSGVDSFLGAGDRNVIDADESFIGSGNVNTVASKAMFGSILGGGTNTVSAEYASILGGFGNVASGSYGIVPGGYGNTAAGIVSFAAGYHADAEHSGSFVWSDYSSGSKPLEDTAANQFVARASGGVYLYSNEAGTSGVKLAPGSGAWSNLSDRNAKARIVPVNDASILAKVGTLPVTAWQYKTERGVRHVGPMAQDFYSMFGLGEDDRHITAIDEAGVALAAIKALRTDDRRRDLELPRLRRRFASIEAKFDALAAAHADRASAMGRRAQVSCTNGGDTFVGTTGAQDSTGGGGSADLGGYGNGACDVNDVIGGGIYNSITNSGNAGDSFIGAGTENAVSGQDAFVGAGNNNMLSGPDGMIGSSDNSIATGAQSAVVAGYGNEADGNQSFVGGGAGNHAIGAGSFIGAGGTLYVTGGGKGIANQVNGVDSFLGAGDQNSVAAVEAFVGAGSINSVGPKASYASILGGSRNYVTGKYASILGGFGNSASGAYGIVAGGNGDSAAGSVSFAAGYHADAAHSGSFVWSDYSSGSAMLKDSAANQFVARASGGVYLYSNEAATSGVHLAPGSGTWSNLSDRNEKDGLVQVDDASILAKVEALPVSMWRYTTEKGVRHVGPMAQDFYATFGIGEDDRHITSIDEDGVALASIKALHERERSKESQIADLRARTALLEAKFLAIAGHFAPAAQLHRVASSRGRQSQAMCSGSGANTFIGITDSGNATGYEASGVLGGAQNGACTADDAIAGGALNSISGNFAQSSFIGVGYSNSITGGSSFIGTGNSQIVSGSGSFIGSGTFDAVGGGESGNAAGAENVVDGLDAAVGAGEFNWISGNGSFIGAGGVTSGENDKENVVNQVTADDSFVGAGDENSIAGNEGFIGSGSYNSIGASATYSSILGGSRNAVTGQCASILGGFGNRASGAYAVVAGGDGDTAAGALSFAAGYHANAAHGGSFVWSDYSSGSNTLEDTAANQFVVRASGGVSLYSNEAATSGVYLAPGSGAWSSLSDRTAKTNIVALDDTLILAKIDTLPVSSWQYKTERGVRHIGPMAQDFYAAFGVGEDARHVASIDEDGVALAAIKALRADARGRANEIAALRARYARLEAELDALTAVRGTRE